MMNDYLELDDFYPDYWDQGRRGQVKKSKLNTSVNMYD